MMCGRRRMVKTGRWKPLTQIGEADGRIKRYRIMVGSMSWAGIMTTDDPLNDVWSSADGKNWSLETANAKWTWRYGHQAVSHSGRLYVLGGNYNGEGILNDVWSSADGKNWSLETANANWTGRYNHQAVVFP